MRRADVALLKPVEDGVAHELRTVVGSQEGWRTVDRDQLGQDVDDASGSDGPGDIDRQGFVGVFVDNGQALDLLSIGAGVEDEVVGPDVVGSPWRVGTSTTRRRSSSRALPGQLQAGLPPEPVGTMNAKGYGLLVAERSEFVDNRTADTATTTTSSI